MGAKKERDERRRKEREEREEKQKQTVKKEIPSDDVKDNDKPKKKLVPIKSKPKDASLPKVRKAEAKGESNDGSAVKARKVMPSKPLVHKSSTPPPSKLKKDESNKKVMETRKAAAARTATRKQPDNEDKNRLSKVSRPSTRKPKEKAASGEERKVDEATVVEKVSKAIASGEIDDSRVVKDDEEDRESIVEKDQIEEMETSPINHHDKDFAKVGDDDEDAELQRIKDEEEEEKEKEEKDALAKKEKEEKEAIARKEKEEKEAAAKKEKDERRRKEREEREEKQKQTVKKEIPSDDVKDNDKPKKKLVPIKSKPKDASLPKVRKAEAKGE